MSAVLAVSTSLLSPGALAAEAPAGATTCSGCHGAGTAVPALAGQSADAIAASMRAFRSGEKPATVMDRIAKGFTDDEVRAIAAWIAAAPR